ALVRRTYHQVGSRRCPRDTHTRAERVLVQHQLVMVPPNARVDGPCAELDSVLNEQRLFTVGALVGKVKIPGGIAIELASVGDAIPKRLAQCSEIRIAAGFPLVRTGANRDRGLHVRFSKST